MRYIRQARPQFIVYPAEQLPNRFAAICREAAVPVLALGDHAATVEQSQADGVIRLVAA